MEAKLYALLLALAVALAGCVDQADMPDDEGDDMGPDGGDDGGDGGDDTPPEPGVLKLATMMPLTGGLNNLGPSMQNGAKLAIADVNAADLGLRIEVVAHEDDKTSDTSAAPNTFNRLAAQGISAVAGPCCSGVTGSILDLAADNEIVVASPSATSPALTERDNRGYFWRIAPSDAVQGKVLAALVEEDGHDNVNLLVVNNPYGTGLGRVFEATFSGTVGATVKHDDGATDFSSVVTAACEGAGGDLDAVVLVVYTDEGAQILKEMHAKDCLSKVKVYASEGVYDPAGAIATKAGQDADGNWLAAGLRGTAPEAADQTAFSAKYALAYPGEQAQTYAAESYDAVMYVALAALKAGSTDGKDLVAAFLDVANGPGQKCSTFATCAGLIKAGQDVDYAGQAHDFDFDDKHEPVTGIYKWWQVQDDGSMETVATGKSA